MNSFLETLLLVKFDTILVLVSAGFAVFAHMFLASSAERDGNMAAVLRKWTTVLDAIPPAKPKGQAARARQQKSRPSPAE